MDRPGTSSRMGSGGIARPSTATRLQAGYRPGTGARLGTGRLPTAAGLGGANVIRLNTSISLLPSTYYLLIIYLQRAGVQLSLRRITTLFN